MINTKKHLIAYQTGEPTTQYQYPSDLKGNPAMQIILSGETIPTGYVYIDTIECWDAFALNLANDYSVVKFQIKDMVELKGWTELTNIEKSLAIKYYSYPDPTTAVIYLMTEKGMTQSQAEGFVLQSWHKHHLKNIVAYTQRWNYAKFTALQYLIRADGEDLFNTVEELVTRYVEVGILGIDFNDSNDGIVDYIYSKHGFTGQGLQENNYTLLQGTWVDFKTALNDVIVEGIYNKYTDIDIN